MSVQARLHALLRANRAISSDLDLPTVLRNIVEAAVELVGARYGALGVVAAHGSGLEQFIHVGFDADQVRAIGRLPEGKGLLGLLVEEPSAVRLDDLSLHPRSVGFPAGHPPMKGFLGVPIRTRHDVFGNLYLTRGDDGGFTREDEEMALALATAAGVAIGNARLYEQARRRQDWLQASTEIAELLLTKDEASLRVIARTVLRLAAADLVTVVLPQPGSQELLVDVAEGDGAEQIDGSRYPLANTISELVLESREAVRLANAEDTAIVGGRTIFLVDRFPAGPVMVIPLVGVNAVRGTLVVARRRDRSPFTQAEQEMATTFANHAATAFELADARRHQQRVAVMEDHARIARDLHDHVIQQLFASGLAIQGVASRLGPGDDANRLEAIVESLDVAIKQIREAIFELRPSRTSSLRSSVTEVIRGLELALDISCEFDGPLDSVSSPALVADVTAVVREALTNVAKHADASRVRLRLQARSESFSLVVTDDGRGIGPTERRSGLDNMRARAESRRGSFQVAPASDAGGTRLEWTVPWD